MDWVGVSQQPTSSEQGQNQGLFGHSPPVISTSLPVEHLAADGAPKPPPPMEVTIEVDSLHDGNDFSLRLSRAKFEALPPSPQASAQLGFTGMRWGHRWGFPWWTAGIR